MGKCITLQNGLRSPAVIIVKKLKPLQDVGLAEGLLEVVLHLVQCEPELGRLVAIWSWKVTMSEVAKP